jgi:hypothetical protein
MIHSCTLFGGQCIGLRSVLLIARVLSAKIFLPLSCTVLIHWEWYRYMEHGIFTWYRYMYTVRQRDIACRIASNDV